MSKINRLPLPFLMPPAVQDAAEQAILADLDTQAGLTPKKKDPRGRPRTIPVVKPVGGTNPLATTTGQLEMNQQKLVDDSLD